MPNDNPIDTYPAWTVPPGLRPTQDQPRPPCMADLLALACRNPAVKHFLTLWERGSLSLEQALAGLACHLAETNERLARGAVRMMATDPRPAADLIGQMLGADADGQVSPFRRRTADEQRALWDQWRKVSDRTDPPAEVDQPVIRHEIPTRPGA